MLEEKKEELTEVEIEGNQEVEEVVEVEEGDEVLEAADEIAEQKDWRDNIYGNVTMSVKTLDIVIGCMIGFIVLVLLVGAVKLLL